MDQEILELWNRMKTIMESTELDVLKTAKGQRSASIRLRASLRYLRKEAQELRDLSFNVKKPNS